MFRFWFALLLLGLISRTGFSSIGKCKNTEFQCKSGNCIPKSSWCRNDNYARCSDGSHRTNCGRYYPNCGNDQSYCINDNRCIPLQYFCDNYNDCADKSDETDCTKIGNRIRNINGVVASRNKARLWIERQRRPDWGWQKDTNRAIITLYLSNPKEFSSANSTIDLMVKQLQIQLSELLLRNETDYFPTHDMAIYVHSLLATCLNPRKFQGYDLVKELQNRLRTSKSVNPLIALAICNSNGTVSPETIDGLNAILKKPNQPQWIDSQALAAMAIVCLNNKNKSRANSLSNEVHDNINNISRSYNTFEIRRIFGKLQGKDGSFGNIYTTALVGQALIALDDLGVRWNIDKCFEYLISKQKSDGSHGDILATYLVLPLMHARTLVDLGNVSCSDNITNKGNLTVKEELDSFRSAKTKVKYAVIVEDTKDVVFGITLNVPKNITFYDVMRLAKELDDRFRFEYVEYPWGMYVYSVFGITNDPEARKYWQLFQVKHGLLLMNHEAPDKVIVNDDAVFTYWYKVSRHFSEEKHATNKSLPRINIFAE